MYELRQVGTNSYYIQSPAKIGLVRVSDTEACLIDSGSDKDAGRRVRKLLDENGWKLRAIYNTHSHADHIGGNRYLQQQTGCRVYAPELECDFVNHPVLEPMILYGGYPPQDLRHKFLMAQPSQAEPLAEAELPEGWQWIPLPGHSWNMMGFRTADDVVYLADSLSSAETLEKYQIHFVYDVAEYVATLEKVRGMQAAWFVPAHAEAAEEVSGLAQKNLDKVAEIGERILGICREPSPFEEILRQLFEGYGLTMDFQQYGLVGSTVRSYLAWLRNQGQAEPLFEGGRMLWSRL